MQQYYQLKYMLLYLKQCITKITIKVIFRPCSIKI